MSEPTGIDPEMFRVLLSKFQGSANFTIAPLFTKIDPVTGHFDQGGIQQVHLDQC